MPQKLTKRTKYGIISVLAGCTRVCDTRAYPVNQKTFHPWCWYHPGGAFFVIESEKNMNELAIIKGVSCYEENGTVFLKLEDVARGLGFVDTSKGVEYIRWSTVRQYLHEIKYSQEVAKDDFIPENVFYRLAMKAKNETAEKFQALVADEIIPSIRRTGGYIAGQEQLTDSELLAKAVLVAQKTIEAREARIAELTTQNAALIAENAQQAQTIADFEPVRQYVDVILESTGTITTTQIAADYGLSAKALNRILHEAGVQFKVNGQWILYREHMGKGYTDSKTFSITRRNGVKDAAMHTYWTQKGRLMIHDILKARGIAALMDRKEA